MSALTLNGNFSEIQHLGLGCRLIKRRSANMYLVQLQVLINERWQTIHEWDDYGALAGYLVKNMMVADHRSALRLLAS